jgi:hypothetical protein
MNFFVWAGEALRKWWDDRNRRKQEKFFREYEAWKLAESRPKSGPSYNCRCYAQPVGFVWKPMTDGRIRNDHYEMTTTEVKVEATKAAMKDAINNLMDKTAELTFRPDEEKYGPNGQLKCLLKETRRKKTKKKLAAGKTAKRTKTNKTKVNENTRKNKQ